MFLTRSSPTHMWLWVELCLPPLPNSLSSAPLSLMAAIIDQLPVEGRDFWEARAAGISLPEHREVAGVGRGDLDKLAECPAHLLPPDSRFGTPLHNFCMCCVSSYQSGTDRRAEIFVSFAAVSPVPKVCPAHSRCSVNICRMPFSPPDPGLCPHSSLCLEPSHSPCGLLPIHPVCLVLAYSRRLSLNPYNQGL